VVSPLSATTQAGGTPVTLTATPAADGGCPTSGLAWALVSGPGSLSTSMGPSAQYTPPAVLCSPDGGDAMISVTALGMPDASTPVSATVHVDPWGAPNLPQLIANATQIAGFDASYPLTGMPHACANAPVVVRWTVDGGAPGVSWLPSDSGIAIYSTDDCA